MIAEQRATITQLQERVRDLETRVGQHSGNSSRPPSSDLPGTPKRPPSRPSGRGRGGQPGHVAHQRAMAPPERVDVVTDHWPLRCQACNTVLPQAPGLPGVAGAPDFVAYQATEFAAIHPRITEYRLYRLACPLCGTRTWASLRTYQDRTRQMQSGFGELLTQGTGSADPRVGRMCDGCAKASTTCGRPSGRIWMSPGSSPPTMWPNVRSGLPACRPLAQGEFRHAVREWCTVCRCHAAGRGDLPDARPGPVRLSGRDLHREHGRPCRPPDPPRPRLIPGCLQAAPDVAGPVTSCAFPTDPRERLPLVGAGTGDISCGEGPQGRRPVHRPQRKAQTV